MPTNDTRQSVLFPEIFRKALTAVFDVPDATSDGGAILLKAADARLGLTDHLARCLSDRRQAGKVVHGLDELLSQRVFGIACGYPDTNDTARLKDDPLHQLLSGRDPRSEEEQLASQATLSRFENSVGPRDLYRMGSTLAEVVVARHRTRLRRKGVRKITIDLDVTDDPTHGSQQLTFFNGFYDTYCYLPLLGFLTFNDEPEQYLFAAILRAGNAPTRLGVLGLLRRLLPHLREVFPKAQVLVRLDGGFVFPELFDLLDASPRVNYVVAMGKNSRLLGLCESEMKCVRELSGKSDTTTRIYGDGFYRSKTWSRERRVIFKAEILYHFEREPKENPRFVVTNLKTSPRHIYERIYCQRCDSENRIKELIHGLSIDRTSCSRFYANQFRVLLSAAAFVLFQEVRWAARGTSMARVQVSTIRERLFKVGAWISCSCRRILIRLPKLFPFRSEWGTIARELGARFG